MLTKVHKLMIGSSIGLGVVFSAFSAHRQNWGMVAAALIFTALMAVYLRWFVQKTR